MDDRDEAGDDGADLARTANGEPPIDKPTDKPLRTDRTPLTRDDYIDDRCYRSSITFFVEGHMVTSSASLAVRVARALTVGRLVLSVAFTALVLVSIATGLFRHGDSLLYGNSITVRSRCRRPTWARCPTGSRLRNGSAST